MMAGEQLTFSFTAAADRLHFEKPLGVVFNSHQETSNLGEERLAGGFEIP